MTYRLPALEASLRRAEQRLKHATARMAWADARQAAGECVTLEAELAEARKGAGAEAKPVNVVGRVRVSG